MKIALIRGSYFNKFEMQNYEPLVGKYEIVGFSGLKPIHEKYDFPLIKLSSPADLPNFPLKMPILNRACLGDAMYLLGLERALRGFDIVHTRETYFHFTQQVLDAKKKGYVKKIICTCSETIPFNHEGIWNRKRFKQRAIREIDVFHCLTNKAKECLIAEGCNSKKIVVFPYGIDLKKFKPKRSKKSNLIRLLFVGRFVKEKGIYDLLKIFISLYKSNKNIRLTLIGHGQERVGLINLINQIRLEKVVKVKQVSYGKIAKEYQKADIFCLLSRATKHWEEYLGMSLIEAMATGLPILSTKSGAIPEVVGKAGLLIKPREWEKGTKAMKRLIENTNLRKKLSFEGRKRSKQHFDSRKIARKIAGLWSI